MEGDYNFYEHAPRNFALCFLAGCASAGECLRALAGADVGTDREVVPVVNPRLADEGGRGRCPRFKVAERVRVAYGFRRALGRVPAGRVTGVRNAACARMSERTYYRLMRGDRPMLPDEQEHMAALLVAHGAPEPVEFDRYEWRYGWGRT